MGLVPSAPSLRPPAAGPAAPLPALVAHADWASLLSGRWLARAGLRDNGSYLAAAPEPAGRGSDLIVRLLDEARGGTVLLGVDFPIGLPEPFALLAGVPDFATWLRQGPPESWFAAASTPEEIALHRPFYPRARGDARRAHLVERLGVAGYGDLLRACDRLTRATCMFWTMGPQQCGKAAIAGWRELARPVALDPELGLWPFEGGLRELLATRRLVLAETYPAECYRQVLSIRGRFSKARRDDREALRGQIAARAAAVGLELGPLAQAVGRGFHDADGADNGFDATVGLLAMLAVLRGQGAEGVPDAPGPRLREGWMMGLTASPSPGDAAPGATAP